MLYFHQLNVTTVCIPYTAAPMDMYYQDNPHRTVCILFINSETMASKLHANIYMYFAIIMMNVLSGLKSINLGSIVKARLFLVNCDGSLSYKVYYAH